MPEDIRLNAGDRPEASSNVGSAPRRILVVDDDPDACEACRSVLASAGYQATGEVSAHVALQRLSKESFDLVVSDVMMPEMSGLDLCQRINERHSGLPVILLTGRGEMDMVISALRAGAVDFLRKPVDLRQLKDAVARALKLRAESSAATPAYHANSSPPRVDLPLMLGQSAPMRDVYQLVADLSGSLASILLQGESGTGKEVIAHAIHDSSHVKDGPFVALNCAAMPAGLLESELFGHMRGAFTDAKTSSKGLFAEANGGTLLLDEIGELPLEMQPKLLRALQERTVRPVGGREEVPFDCRLITATNRDLEHEVTRKRFREDLYYRLDVVRVTVPPLRERGSDILALARHFVTQFAKPTRPELRLGGDVINLLLRYRWPGNVRELENCIEHAVAMARGEELTIADLPGKIRSSDATREPLELETSAANVLPLNEVERRHILRAIELVGGNKTAAAKLLGINRRTLQRRLRDFGAAGEGDAGESSPNN